MPPAPGDPSPRPQRPAGPRGRPSPLLPTLGRPKTRRAPSPTSTGHPASHRGQRDVRGAATRTLRLTPKPSGLALGRAFIPGAGRPGVTARRTNPVGGRPGHAPLRPGTLEPLVKSGKGRTWGVGAGTRPLHVPGVGETPYDAGSSQGRPSPIETPEELGPGKGALSRCPPGPPFSGGQTEAVRTLCVRDHVPTVGTRVREPNPTQHFNSFNHNGEQISSAFCPP